LDVKASEAEQETTARVETDPRTSLKLAVDSYEYEYIKDVLKKHNGNVTKASKELGIHRSVLYKKMKKQELT
jgi:transcriptional regulator with PAS, ATPase and Fis domain